MKDATRKDSAAWCGLLALTALIVTTLVVSGCGRGPKLYRVSGTVSFQGQPVPAGRIVFDPDVTQENSGPQGYAEIKNGSYDTRSGRGTVGGPHVVRIRGLDGSGSTATALFNEYSTKVDLPLSRSTEDFEVPASAAQARSTGAGPAP